jgi:hypothetical protein
MVGGLPLGSGIPDISTRTTRPPVHPCLFLYITLSHGFRCSCIASHNYAAPALLLQ